MVPKYECGIYYLQDPNSKEIRYIGKSIHLSLRAHIHLQPCIYGKSPFPVYNWIRKLARRGSLPEVKFLQTFQEISNEDLGQCEAARILNIRSRDINAVLRGRQITAKGYKFSYCEGS
jgi:hypothetical protein